MKRIEAADGTYGRLAFAAKVFGVSVGEVVARLVDAPDEPQPTSDGDYKAQLIDSDDPEDEVAVHVFYQGSRIQGIFDRTTKQLRITSGPLAGRTYPSPSAAAIAVAESVNPGRGVPADQRSDLLDHRHDGKMPAIGHRAALTQAPTWRRDRKYDGPA